MHHVYQPLLINRGLTSRAMKGVFICFIDKNTITEFCIWSMSFLHGFFKSNMPCINGIKCTYTILCVKFKYSNDRNKNDIVNNEVFNRNLPKHLQYFENKCTHKSCNLLKIPRQYFMISILSHSVVYYWNICRKKAIYAIFFFYIWKKLSPAAIW